jgi:hypothetical protein
MAEITPTSEIRKDGTLAVLCTFLDVSGNLRLTGMLPVEHAKYELRPIIVNNVVVGDEVYVISGFITLRDKGERYIAYGTPPFTYKENLPTPISPEEKI